MRRAWFLPVVALTLLPVAVWPQGNPIGPEFLVNSSTAGFQYSPAVAADARGHFVVMWESSLAAPAGILGQRYDSSGTPLGAEFRANTYTTGFQIVPAVASDPSGNFVVVWTNSVQDGSSNGIFGQRFTSSGAPAGPEFRVNTYTSLSQGLPSVAVDSAGNFVVAWNSQFQDGSYLGVFAQRYASTGEPIGPEFRVNTFTPFDQTAPSVGTDPTGNFVVVWTSEAGDGSSYGVFGQRFAASGTPVGAQFRVNTYTTNSQASPEVDVDGTGNFVVVWPSGLLQDPSGFGVFGQRFAASGVPVGPEFRVNTFVAQNQFFPSVAVDDSGNFVVVWQSLLQDGSGYGVFGQRYDATGAPLGAEFRVNTYVDYDQERPAVTVDNAGEFVVVWASAVQDGSGPGIFGQRYRQIVPVQLIHMGVE
jgi:hypothetical protein